MKTVAMLGDGAWGTAVATLLARNGYTVKMWGHDAAHIAEMQATRMNQRYVPGVMLHKNIVPTSSLQETLHNVTWVFEAIPVQFLRSVLEQAKEYFNVDQRWVVLSKGIEQDTFLLPGLLIDDVFDVSVRKIIFSGPSFAADLIKEQVTAVTLASRDEVICKELQRMLANSYFRPYLAHDEIGAQVGGALKNVVALGVGMIMGAGGTDNAKAFIMTRGLHEMVEVAVQLGAHRHTLYGLAGVGDLVLSSMGALGRNLEVGKRIGQGQTVAQIINETGYIPEGINTVHAMHQLMQRYNLDLPVIAGVYAVVAQGLSVDGMVQELMLRPLENETL